jgi:radical SAM superfamily enzyme YgiQ (UPF0313 family)
MIHIRRGEPQVFENVLFVIPPAPMGTLFTTCPSHPHSGVGYLSEFLTKNGVENHVLDMRLNYTYKELFERIQALNPDLIGVTSTTYGSSQAYKIISQIGNREFKQHSGFQIVLGGPHVSALGPQVLQQCNADFAVSGEGEHTLLELCQQDEKKKILGLMYKEQSKVVVNERRRLLKNLDALPYPTYEKFELNKYTKKEILITSSRGCPFNCTFCSIALSMGRQWRARSPEHIIEEINYWYKRGYKEFDFIDDNFTLSKERTLQICELIKQNNFVELDLKCGNGIRADRTDRELLAKMKEAGFTYLAFGVESGNNRILRHIKKAEDLEKIEQAIRNSVQLGFDVGLFFIIGHPEETKKEVEESFNLALKYPVFHVFFYNALPYPGTELFEYIKTNNLFIKDPKVYLKNISYYDNEPVYATREFPAEKRKEMLVKAKQIQDEVLRKHMLRSLARYGILGSLAAVFISPLIHDPNSNSTTLRLMQSKKIKKSIFYLAKTLNLGSVLW